MLLSRRNQIFPSPFEPFAGLLDELTTPHHQPGPNWPPLDVVEEQDSFTVTLDVPGMKREELAIEFEEQLLTITGERKQADDERRWHRRERFHGSFRRRLRFADVDPEKIAAAVDAGVLTVTLGKAEAAKPRQIEIG